MRTASRFVTVVVLALLAALALVPPAFALQVGDKAPEFELPGPEGKPVKLADLTAKGPVVLYTFIAAFTPT
jgi:peroxiredoxin Q/BCP